MVMARIESIWRYPVKGLSGDRLPHASLAAGEGLPFDRAWAIAHGTTQFDPEAPEWLPKANFLMLMRNERLAQLATRFDEATRQLSVLRDGRQVASGNLDQPIGRKLLEQFFAAYCAGELRGHPRVVAAPGHMFSDSRRKSVSIIGLATLTDIERVAHRTVDPLRFRANLYLSGTRPWEEFYWLDREIRIGEVRLRVTKRIDRCPATEVDPRTGARDLPVPKLLLANFGHVDTGVYAEVIAPGRITEGDDLILG